MAPATISTASTVFLSSKSATAAGPCSTYTTTNKAPHASTGKTEATFTYDFYGNQTGHTGTATTRKKNDAIGFFANDM